ncbi:MAG: pachytene checkpoint protein 2 [Actinomycetota bacterium]|jgi:SpoVK/Ycf46/Vps4 family AAA+-type ATPase|nr:pachytene checkpoint protein 2 [Actinomycetota bacterium]
MKVEECITTNEWRPTGSPEDLWASIVTEGDVKDRLFRSALLALQLRPELPFTTTALHGLVLLYGPPGTGKTTLARGLADQLAAVVPGKRVRLIEVNPHGLMSAEHGQSQQLVMDLLSEHVPALADDRSPTVVVLDEVESICVARSAASLSANPADVHRATDAVLTALDRNTATHPHLVTVATSNFTNALDEAFKSRADDAILMPVPSAAAIITILQITLAGFSVKYPKLTGLVSSRQLARVAALLVGLDGRQVRKVVTDAMKVRSDTVLDPNELTIADLLAAATERANRVKNA